MKRDSLNLKDMLTGIAVFVVLAYVLPRYAAVAEPTLNLQAIAQKTAELANRTPPPLDDGTVSFRVRAEGTRVIYEYVLAIRRDASDADLAGWRSEVRRLIISEACQLHRHNLAFKQGLRYVYLYLNRDRQKLAEIVVSPDVCGG